MVVEYFIRGIKQYNNFQGRDTRKQYWMFILFYIIFYFACALVDATLGLFIFAPIYSIALLLPTFSIAARRLHDIGKSGWWQLLFLIPFGALVLIYFFVQKSTEDNEYGPMPAEILITKESS
jgi:uncharacterized membrane protein YhaH (DUF805 family)